MPTIGFCMTNNVSLLEWEKLGQSSRELIYFKKFIEKGYSYKIITYGDNKDLNIFKERNLEIIPLYSQIKFLPIGSINFLMHLVRIKKKYKSFKNIDILKTNQLKASYLAILISFLFKKKILLRIGYEPLMNLEMRIRNNYFKKNKFKNILHYLKLYFSELISYNFSSHITCTTSIQKKFIIKRFLIKKSKITVIPNWVETNIFYPSIRDIKKRGILFVGRLEVEKNPELLVKSLEGINEKLTIIGSGSLKKNLLNLASSLNVNIEILDPIPNIELVEYYRKCKIYVIPSFYEGNPKSLLEAMACGCSVIGKNTIGIKNIIGKNRGILFNTIDDLKKSILHLLSDNEKAFEYSRIATDFIHKNNNIEFCLEKEKRIIKKILNF